MRIGKITNYKKIHLRNYLKNINLDKKIKKNTTIIPNSIIIINIFKYKLTIHYMIITRIGFLFVLLFFFSISSYSYEAVCTNEINPYIVQCTIPKQYFIQDFTCLNSNCSIRIENRETHQNLLIPNKKTSILLQNYIELKHIYPHIEILNTLCKEQFSSSVLSKISLIIEEKNTTHESKFSGEKLLIQPLNYNTVDEYTLQLEKDIKQLDECYITKITIYENWIVTSKEKKTYCEIQFNSENSCYETIIKKGSFLNFIFSNPNSTTLPYVLFIFLFLSLVGSSFLFTKNLKKEKKIKQFFTITKTKILIKLILFVPILHSIGFILNYLVNVKYYFYISNTMQMIITIISILIIYLLSSLIEFIINKKN